MESFGFSSFSSHVPQFFLLCAFILQCLPPLRHPYILHHPYPPIQLTLLHGIPRFPPLFLPYPFMCISPPPPLHLSYPSIFHSLPLHPSMFTSSSSYIFTSSSSLRLPSSPSLHLSPPTLTQLCGIPEFPHILLLYPFIFTSSLHLYLIPPFQPPS